MKMDVKESEFRGRPHLEFYDLDAALLSFKDKRELPFFTLNVDTARIVVQYIDEIQRFAENHRDL